MARAAAAQHSVSIETMTCAALRLVFETDKFLLSGSLPKEVNAGNQFYGEDLANWICESLVEWKPGYW